MRRPGPIFVFGATSMPGWSLVSCPRGGDLIPFCNPHTKLSVCRNWRRFRLEDRDAYRDLFRSQQPRVVIHCGGICDVEKCEADPMWARSVNVASVGFLLDRIPEETRLVYVSSDHVFGGRQRPYDEKSRISPISVYGKTRVDAEKQIRKRKKNSLILRYALGIGPSIDGRSGHLDWMRYRRGKDLPITIIQDEFRSAVWAEDLAQRVLDYAESPITGVRHITTAAAVSRIDLAERLNARYGLGVRFLVRSREERPVPHLGKVELATVFTDRLAKPLPPVIC